MTSQTSSPPAPESPADQPRVGMWAAAMVVAAIVALLGVQAATGALQRRDYFEAAVTATYLLTNGNAIRPSTERLQFVNARDRLRVNEALAALDAGDGTRFNRIMDQVVVDSREQERLQKEVQEYKAGFDLATRR